MTFPEIVMERLVYFLCKVCSINPSAGGIAPKTTLGGTPFNLTSATIGGPFLGWINGEPLGFSDILGRKIASFDLSTASTLSDVADKIVARSNIQSEAEYLQGLGSHLLVCLQSQIASHQNPPVNFSSIDPTRSIESYFTPNPQLILTIANELNSELEKYVIETPVTAANLTGQISSIVAALVGNLAV